MFLRRTGILATSLFIFAAPLLAQSTCPPPPMPSTGRELILFDARQEVDLGDAVAAQLERNFRVISDDEINAYLQRVGQRLAAYLAGHQIPFQFFLVDLPYVNAFTIPGGRIYVTRKLVAYTRSEDELAGVVAHEMGHSVARDGAITVSRYFREILKVNSVSDHADIFEKFHQFTENAARRPEAVRRAAGHGSDAQIAADQLAIYLAARAGYAPQAYSDFWDRYTETKGKTGNWFSDLFGATRPESRRLREMLRTIGALPAECVDRRPTTSEEYAGWQKAVVAYMGLGRKESVPGLLSKKSLEPPLRGDITHLKFSPDGKYVLAQDDAAIYVLTHEPFEVLFRMDAPDANRAQFSPDSKRVVFYGDNLHVEWWDIEEEQRVAAHEVTVRENCWQTLLSPDGKQLACVSMGFELLLLDVSANNPVFRKKDFYITENRFAAFEFVVNQILNPNYRPFRMEFSPDGKYLVVARRDTALAVDTAALAPVNLPGSIKKFLAGGFAFLGPDRIIAVNAEKPEKSAVLTFPDAKVETEIVLGKQEVDAPAKGGYILLRPIDKYAVGVMSLETKKIFMANKTSAFDICDRHFISERITGELALYSADAADPLKRIVLPRSNFGGLRAAALSPDMEWLAVSSRTRGAVWNLKRNERVFYTRGFRGAHIAGGTVYADFPKFGEQERMIGRLDLASRQPQAGPLVEEQRTEQYGPYLTLLKPKDKEKRVVDNNVTMEVRSTQTNELLWTRPFPDEVPRVFIEPNEGTMVFSWQMTTKAARDEIKESEALKKRWKEMKERDDDYYLEIVSARDGKRLGQLMVETGKGSFRIRNAYVSGDFVIINDNQNRLLVFSLATGELRGRTFGSSAAVAGPKQVLCSENLPGQLSVYDLASLQPRAQFSFSSPVSMTRFSPDGNRLFVLTANQTVYVLDTSAISAQSPVLGQK